MMKIIYKVYTPLRISNAHGNRHFAHLYFKNESVLKGADSILQRYKCAKVYKK